MKNIFASKGLAKKKEASAANEDYQIDVILLLHKMRITFYKEEAERCGVSPDAIVDEVEDLGFGAELIGEEVDESCNIGDKKQGKD